MCFLITTARCEEQLLCICLTTGTGHHDIFTHTYTQHCSTAPHRRPELNFQPPVATMHANPNFARGTPGRSTYAYGSRRPPPVSAITRYEGTPTTEASSQPSPGPVGGGFFKRLIPSRFSRRYNSQRRYTHVTFFSTLCTCAHCACTYHSNVLM